MNQLSIKLNLDAFLGNLVKNPANIKGGDGETPPPPGIIGVEDIVDG
ncbi:MAG TPA: hypothetical protein PKE06_22295 [Flavilitoribacter sp.]|nr:hypothetical protein [Flavilitoribacter sp.]HMQ88743.1 hypothetical protein [Flavilitoribacter sp.]